ncbi:Matrix metalloproteinase-2 [Hondaea fermentalgiana]|uniref:Matrix metalloproteinase-2 n=1 Tax=Hondaea fermentalgiana TaxID=2315210 RepID=A0A2R5G0U5_9STRA|nr:Matrix metalloproteinase-2 [Hondaea fermentalgiana]|eukprot:GBG24632.1 Matrix metalloproteinase-2 [Hondaea fermentalgiana]
MGSGLSVLTEGELKAHISKEDEQSLEVIREAWKTKDSFLVPQRQSEIVEFLQDILEEAVEESCPMQVSVRVIAALGLQKADSFSESDAYVRVSLQGNEATFTTKIINNCRSPVWDQTFTFDAPGARAGDTLTFDVFDSDFFSKDDDIGRTSVLIERRRRGINTESVFQQLLDGGRGVLVFNYALAAPPLQIRESKSFESLLQNCDAALDLVTQHDPARASGVRARISDKIQTMAAAIANDRVVTRQDIRTLSPEMTQRYLAAVERMMMPQVVRDGERTMEDLAASPELLEEHGETSTFFRLAGYHGWPEDFCAHRQENFPAWHRAYLVEYERELRKADRELGNDGHIALPYWDFGEYEVNGQVLPAAYRDLKGLPEGFFKMANLGRQVATRGFQLSSDEVARSKLERAEMAENLSASLEENNHWRHASCENTIGRPLEAPHNSAHMASGWPVTSLAYAAFHPLFYNIHCNVDRYYEKYLQLEPNSLEEFEAHQKMRVDSDTSVSNKFEEPLKPFKNPETDDFFSVHEIMSTPTHQLDYVFDALPQLRPALLSELPTLALFEKVDVALSLRDQEDNMKSFELHVFVVPARSQEGFQHPTDLPAEEWPRWASEHGCSYAGWATAFGGKGRSCKNCKETRPVNISVDISEQLRAIDETRHNVVLKTICVDEVGEAVPLEEIQQRFGENCIIPQPRVAGPLFASTDLILSKTTASASAEASDLGTSAETSQLQWYLHQFGFYPGKPDGDFGDQTEAAVKRFQQHVGIFADGIAGPITKRAMLMKRNDALPDTIFEMSESDTHEDFEDVPKFPAGSTVTWWLGPHPGYLNSAHLEEEVTAAINLWAEHAPLNFERVESRSAAKLVITWGDQAEQNEFKFDGRGGAIAQSSEHGIEFDINERWSLSLHQAKRYGRNTFKVLPVLLHELGHTLGLRTHSVDPSHVMGAYYVSNRIKLSSSEIARLNEMYAS